MPQFFSCSDQDSYRTQSVIHNNTIHSIDFFFYGNGEVVNEQTIALQPYQTILVFEDAGEGTGEGLSYSLFLELHRPTDSLHVRFDNAAVATHFSHGIQGLNQKALSFEAPRNFYNRANWRKDIVSKRRTTEHTVTFTFTEQDYLDAQ